MFWQLNVHSQMYHVRNPLIFLLFSIVAEQTFVLFLQRSLTSIFVKIILYLNKKYVKSNNKEVCA